MTVNDEDRSQVRAMVARRVAVIAAALALALAIAVTVYGVVVIRGTQNTNKPKIDNTAQTLQLVKDCVLPSGVCYARGQRQTAKAIGSINAGTRDVIVATLVCRDRGVRGFEPIARCVDRALAQVATTRKH